MPIKDPDKRREYMKVYRQKKLAAGLCECGDPVETDKNYCSACCERRRQLAKTIHQKRRDAGQCVHCGAEAVDGKKCCLDCQLRARERCQKQRTEALEAYGKQCACCGEDEVAFLVINHIENNGAEHRREIGTGNLYGWLKSNKFPTGFQTLCWNCNAAKAIYGVCPHQKKKNDNLSENQAGCRHRGLERVGHDEEQVLGSFHR